MIKFNADLFRAVYHFVSSEETRYYLKGVFVCPAENVPGVHMVATDGHKMLVGYDSEGIAPESGVIIQTQGNKIPGKEMTCPRNATRLDVSIAKHNLHENGPNMTGQVIAHSEAGENLHGLVMLTEVEATFPQWQKVLPTGEIKGQGASFNANYIAQLAKVAGVYSGRKDPVMRILQKDMASPALVTFGPPQIDNGGACGLFGVIMPMRNGPERTPPESIGAAMPSWAWEGGVFS